MPPDARSGAAPVRRSNGEGPMKNDLVCRRPADQRRGARARHAGRDDRADAAVTTPDPVMTATDPAATALPRPDATNPIVQPSNANPEEDARGIPVISDAATAPAGFNQPATVARPESAARSSTRPPRRRHSRRPRLSALLADVTDNCVQTYERRSSGPDDNESPAPSPCAGLSVRRVIP